jgi:NADPH-dependent 2,4-dienoyl-CoA reductase/sulfur reductase-like enzyme
MRVVIIGGVAAGPKAASRIIRLCPDAEVTIIERNELLSYAGCGLPYYVSGEVKEQKELMATPVGVVRDPVFFQKVKNVSVRNCTEAVAIDRAKKTVMTRDCKGMEEDIAYDYLVLATGAGPITPPIPGITRSGICRLYQVEDSEHIKELLANGKTKDVVIVGGGLIGIEMTEALAEHGCRITLIEALDQILTMLDPEMALLVEQYLESKGVRVLTGAKAVEFMGDGESGPLEGVRLDNGTIVPAELVLMSIGVRPNTALARGAGLTLDDATGAIQVNDHMCTSDPAIYAAGDCVACKHLITGKSVFIPLGSTANKHGRVAANNICGQKDSFPGVLGSSVCKVFDFTIARTGLGEHQARKAGYSVGTVLAPSPDKAHFMSSRGLCC